MFDLKQLKEDQQELLASMKALDEAAQAEERSLSEEEAANFDALEDSYKENENKIATLERSNRLKALKPEQKEEEKRSYTRISVKPQPVTQKDHELAFRAWALNQAGEANLLQRSGDYERMMKAVDKTGVNLANKSFDIQLRDQSSDVAGEGGNLTNEGVVVALEKSLNHFSGMRQAARVISTTHGNDLLYPTMDDTANSASYQSAQNDAVTNTSVAFGTPKRLQAYTAISGVFPVALQLFEDSAIDISQIVGDALGERLGRFENDKFTNGTGTSEPEGVLAGAGDSGVAPSVGGDGLTYDDLVDCIHAVDIHYRQGSNVAWMMSDSTLGELHKLVDTTGRPLFWSHNDRLSNGEVGVLLGYPVRINNSLPDSSTATNKPIVFGNWDRAIIRDVNSVQIRTLNERYIPDNLAIGFVAWARHDFKVLNANALKYIEMAA